MDPVRELGVNVGAHSDKEPPMGVVAVGEMSFKRGGLFAQEVQEWKYKARLPFPARPKETAFT